LLWFLDILGLKMALFGQILNLNPCIFEGNWYFS